MPVRGCDSDYNIMNRFLLSSLALTVAASSLTAYAQQADSDKEWYVGIGGGVNFSRLSYSDLDKSYFPDNHSNLSGQFSVFAEFDFGHNQMFAIRPQLSFLTRGGRLNNIGLGSIANYDPDFEGADHLDDFTYKLKARCFDIRLPLIYQIGSSRWRVRPYAYVAPIASIVSKGYTSVQTDFGDKSYQGVRYPLTDANMAKALFSGAVGLGAKWQFDISGSTFFLGLDISYQHEFTNNYGKREKDGSLDNIVNIGSVNAVKVGGSRRFQGFEIQASFGIPLSIFHRKPEPTPSFVEEPVTEEIYVAPPAPVKDCYTLDEIIALMDEGEEVEGKTICAINDITFDFSKSEIHPDSYPFLDKLAQTIKRTGAEVVIKGHTDNIGTPQFNMQLSKDRALAVYKYLLGKGVDSHRLSYAYYGMTRPLVSNDTEEGREMNRRVEFEILKN